jgi:protein arginine kinase activator
MKNCDLCGKSEATLPVQRVDKDGKRTDLVVCAECAVRHGFAAGEAKPAPGEVLSELKGRVAEEDSRLACPRCGLSWADFKRGGRLGCSDCYAVFHDRLEPVVRRIHGAAQHVGRTPSGGRKHAQAKMNVQKLREALASAIKQEDYEQAAGLRDRLRTAEGDAHGE